MKVKITTPYITLGQLLKFENVIGNGGDAKIFLATNSVLVNGELEQRRGRKCYNGDKIQIDDKEYVIEG